jgi:hypothetical protein
MRRWPAQSGTKGHMMAKTNPTAGKDTKTPDSAPAADAAAAAASGAPTQASPGDGGDDGDVNDAPPAPTPAPPKPPTPPPPPPAAARLAPAFLPETDGRNGQREVNLLLDACERYGVNPEVDARPVELLSWRYYAADPTERTPAAVVIVTAGGQKLKHWDDPSYPMDPDTEERLRNIFGAWKKDKDGTRIPTQLPGELTLPESAVTGLVQSDDHQYKRGYLREGGKVEADRRRR